MRSKVPMIHLLIESSYPSVPEHVATISRSITDRWCDVVIPDCYSVSLHCESIAVRIIAYTSSNHTLRYQSVQTCY